MSYNYRRYYSWTVGIWINSMICLIFQAHKPNYSFSTVQPSLQPLFSNLQPAELSFYNIHHTYVTQPPAFHRTENNKHTATRVHLSISYKSQHQSTRSKHMAWSMTSAMLGSRIVQLQFSEHRVGVFEFEFSFRECCFSCTLWEKIGFDWLCST